MKRNVLAALLIAALALTTTGLMTACTKNDTKPEVVKIDFAYYNPVSLVLKDKNSWKRSLPRTISRLNGF
jgi:sulfonate transport system substrate-binding protein